MTPYQESLMPEMRAAVRADVEAIKRGDNEPSLAVESAFARSALTQPARGYTSFAQFDFLTMQRMHDAGQSWAAIADEIGHPIGSCKGHFYTKRRPLNG